MIDKLKEIKKYCDAATEGPWKWRFFGSSWFLVQDIGSRKCIITSGYTRDEEGVLVPMNEEQPVSLFIAKSRTDLPKLLSALECAVEALDKYTSNPDNWDKTKEEWFAIHAKQALKEIQDILGGE